MEPKKEKSVEKKNSKIHSMISKSITLPLLVINSLFYDKLDARSQTYFTSYCHAYYREPKSLHYPTKQSNRFIKAP